MNRKVRTPLLAAVVFALAAANLWWFLLRTPEPPTPAFELGSTQGVQVGVDAAAIATAPLFDPVHDRWTIDGAPATNLAERLRSSPANDIGIPVVRYLMVRLADDANSEQVRRALLSLARQRICLVALVDAAGLPRDGGAVAAPVHRIVSVRGNDGNVIGCTSPDSSSRT